MTSLQANPILGGEATGPEAGEGEGAKGNRNGKGSGCKGKWRWTGGGGVEWGEVGRRHGGGGKLGLSMIDQIVWLFVLQ